MPSSQQRPADGLLHLGLIQSVQGPLGANLIQTVPHPHRKARQIGSPQSGGPPAHGAADRLVPDIRLALQEPLAQITEAVHSVLEKTPPELAADIVERGIVLTGGGCLLDGMEELIEEKTGINTVPAEDPFAAVAIGVGR